MACFQAIPPELKLMIMERMPDVCSLFALTLSCSTSQKIYDANALQIVQAVTGNGPSGTASLMRETIAARHSNEQVALGVDHEGTRYWMVPAACNIWEDADRFREHARQLLKGCADTAHRLSELADWVQAHQYDARVEIVQVSAPLSRDDIHTALWQLELYIALTGNANVGEPPASRYYPSTSQIADETYRRQYYLQVATNVRESWLESCGSDELHNITCVLNTLESGHGRLIRHMLMPETGTMLHILFARRSLRACWTRRMRIRARAHQLDREPQRQHMSFAQTMAEFRRRGAQDDSEYGVLEQVDEEAYEHYRGTVDITKSSRDRYLQPLSPLLGLPYGSKVVVAELVGTKA
ncbi:hypothetical protein LTR85_012186 [Meristemomyces frigidus]|nr:hypothetical protein LTR85_012186 [Meristemomyces frigidus]